MSDGTKTTATSPHATMPFAPLLLFILLLLTSGCSHAAGKGKVGNNKDKNNLAGHLKEFRESVNPDSMTPEELEQWTVDYIYITQNADSVTRKEAWRFLAAEIYGNRPDRTVTDYLGDPESPIHDPEMLEEYLLAVLENPADETSRLRAEYILKDIRKNRPGSRIADLGVITPQGKSTTLHRMITEAFDSPAAKDSVATILFYDPECDTCTETIATIASEKESRRIIAINVSSTADKNASSTNKNILHADKTISIKDKEQSIPASWIKGRVKNEEEGEENFHFPRLPAIYEVAPDLTIFRKE